MRASGEKSESDRYNGWARSPGRYLLISLYWFPISLFWGMMLGQILPARVEDFSGAAHKGAFLGTISVIGALASAAVQLVIGPISDRYRGRFGRRRPFVAVGTAVACLAMLAFGWAQSFAELTAAYFFIQLFLNVANGPYIAYMPELVPRARHGAASAYMGIMQLLGKAGGPLLAGLAVSSAMAPYASAGPGNHAAMLAASVARLAAFRHLLLLDVGLFALCGAVTVTFVPDWPSQSPQNAASAVRKMLRWDIRGNDSFFRLLVSRAVYNLGFYIALTYLQYYVQDSLGLGFRYAPVLTNLQVATIGGATVGTIPAGLFADRISKKSIVYVSCAFSAAATAAFGLTHSLAIAYAMAIAFGIGYGAFCAVDWALACNLLPDGGTAKFMAVWSLSDTIPQVIAPAFGPVADLINRGVGPGDGWRAAMLIAAASVLLGAAAMRRVRERSTSPTDSELSAHALSATP